MSWINQRFNFDFPIPPKTAKQLEDEEAMKHAKADTCPECERPRKEHYNERTCLEIKHGSF